MDLPGYDDWKLASPPEQPCDCGCQDCAECYRRAMDEAAFDRSIDLKIDEAKERGRER